MSGEIFIIVYLLIGLIGASALVIHNGYVKNTCRTDDEEPIAFIAVLLLWPFFITLFGFAALITGLKFLGKSLRRR